MMAPDIGVEMSLVGVNSYLPDSSLCLQCLKGIVYSSQRHGREFFNNMPVHILCRRVGGIIFKECKYREPLGRQLQSDLSIALHITS